MHYDRANSIPARTTDLALYAGPSRPGELLVRPIQTLTEGGSTNAGLGDIILRAGLTRLSYIGAVSQDTQVGDEIKARVVLVEYPDPKIWTVISAWHKAGRPTGTLIGTKLLNTLN